MSLDALDAELDTIRSRAAEVQKQAGRELAAVRQDPNLSDQGKLEAERAIKERHKATLETFRGSEDAAVDIKMTELQRRLDAMVGNGSSDIIAFRDAQDRAERITNGDEAATIMARAVRTDDKTLAHAVYRRAIENRWTEARKTFTDKYPAAAEAGRDLAKLEDFKSEGWFARSIAYSVSSF